MIFCIFGGGEMPSSMGVCRGACPLPYWGIFSDTEYCGSENSLISYGIFSVNTLRRAVRLPFGGGCPCRLLTRITPPYYFSLSVGGGRRGGRFRFQRLLCSGRSDARFRGRIYPKHEGGDCSPNGVAARPCSRRKAPCLLRLCKRE